MADISKITLPSGDAYNLKARTITETLPISLGGTGKTTALEALQNLGANSNKAGSNGATLIPNNSDLNSYTTPGTYYIPTAASAATIANVPCTTSGCKVFVEGNYNASYLVQFVTAASRFYFRIKAASNGWMPWRQWGSGGIISVKGTQTESTGTWTGSLPIPELYDGLTIAYYVPYAVPSSTNVTLTLTLSTGTVTDAIPVYTTNATRATTQYGAGSTVLLTYWSAGSISVAGTATTEDRWTRADYNSNTDTKVRQTLNSGNTNRPLLMAYSANTVTTSNVDNVSYRNNSIYANASTGLVTAKNFANSHGTIAASYTASTETITITL